MLLTLFLLVVFVAVAALMWLQGLWSNVVTLVNVLFAALLATILYEPVTEWAVDMMKDYSYLLDFLILWLLFSIFYSVLRLITDILSPRRIVFHPQVELIGRSIMCLIVAYVMIMFTTMTLHTAPIQANPFGNAALGQGNFLGMSPDKQWISFVRGQSKQMGLRGSGTFDDNGMYIQSHYERRQAFEQLDGFLD